MTLLIDNIVLPVISDRARMEAHGSARLSRKRKREGSNGEAEESEKPLKLKRCTLVSMTRVFYVQMRDVY